MVCLGGGLCCGVGCWVVCLSLYRGDGFGLVLLGGLVVVVCDWGCFVGFLGV